MKSKTILIYYKTFAITTFTCGLALHISRIFVGAEYFLENILTISNDRIFSIPMTLSAIFAWLAFKSIDFKTSAVKICYLIIAGYTTISVPVHVKSWFTTDLKQLEAFPEYYSYIITPVIFFMLLFTIYLKPKN